MGWLLDTHTLIWHLEANPRLSIKARDAIRHPEALVFVSVASLWEIVIKTALGKLTIPVSFADLHRRVLPAQGFRVLNITPEHLERLAVLPRIDHRDPFDRLLVAQTFVEDLRLISDDPLLDAYGVPLFW